jgi:hypothetical protein
MRKRRSTYRPTFQESMFSVAVVIWIVNVGLVIVAVLVIR